MAETRVVIGDFELDRASGELRRRGADEACARLGPQPAALLGLLVDRHGDIVTHDEIRERIWPDVAIDFEASLHHCIRQVRTAFGERASDAGYIETVPRRGYRLKVTPSAVATAAAETTPAPPRSRARPVLAIVLAIGAAALAAGWLAPGTPAPTRVALLPFEDPHLDPTTAAASSQLGERVLAQLTKRLGDTADVIGPRTTAPLRARGMSVPEIATQTGAAYSLNARFTASAGRAELLVELIRSTDGKHVWVEYYEAPTQWELAAPEIVAGVAAALER